MSEADRYAVIAEGWALTDDEVSPASRVRLAELRAQSLFTVSCGCAECEASPLADAAQVQVTLDEWDRLKAERLVKIGHATDGGRPYTSADGIWTDSNGCVPALPALPGVRRRGFHEGVFDLKAP